MDVRALDVTERIYALVRDVFVDPTLQLTRQTTAADVAGWDSLSHVRLLMTIERELGIRFSPAEGAKPRNVGELADLVVAKMDKS